METWLKPSLSDGHVNIDGFQIIRLDRLHKRGGGVALYLNNLYAYETMSDELNVSNEDVEVLTIKVFRRYQNDLYISVVYLPPKANMKNAIYCLNKIAEAVTGDKRDWILSGDLNIDFKKSTPNYRLINNFADRYTLTQLITKATRVTKNSATIIDHIYTSLGRDMIKGGVIKYGLSDHDIVFAIIKKVQAEKSNNVSFTCRDMRYYSIDGLRMQLDLCDWSYYYDSENPNELWQILHYSYTKCLELIAPLTTLNNVKPKKTWVNSELLHLIRKRDDYKARADLLLQNESFKEFKKLKIKVKRDTIKAKREFIMGKIRNA